MRVSAWGSCSARDRLFQDAFQLYLRPGVAWVHIKCDFFGEGWSAPCTSVARLVWCQFLLFEINHCSVLIKWMYNVLCLKRQMVYNIKDLKGAVK